LALAACAELPGNSGASPPVLASAAQARTSSEAGLAGVEVPDVGVSPAWVIAVHGGAGVPGRDALSPEREAAVRAAMTEALEAGAAVLRAGGEGAAAVEAAIVVMEDSPLFNAGRGAALDEQGNARHDASIMRGVDQDAGAVAGSSRIRNPITAARAVMERTEDVLLHGDGADWFAAQEGLALANPIYFETEERRAAVLRAQEEAGPGGDSAALEAEPDQAFGTVGAVVLDTDKNLAAGTSTGGRTNKRYGRIGDSPIIGAGTYASNSSCAVSATGEGEYFIRWTAARDVCARMELAGESLEEATRAVLAALLAQGGEGGVIAIDPSGAVVFSMNDLGMFRGVMSSATPARTAVYVEEEVR
jgi:beta-aspartyl-peptidase (threonine type)